MSYRHSLGTYRRTNWTCEGGRGSWTIAEHISHLAEVQPMLLERFQRFVKEDRPEFVPYIPGEGTEEPVTPLRMEIPEGGGRI